MRITQRIIHRNFLINLGTITDKINTQLQRISSAKRLIRLSDDPDAVSRVMELKDEFSKNVQYIKNIEFAIEWLRITESAFNSMEDVLNRLEEIAISMGSDNVSEQARKTAAEEVARLKEHALMIANTRFRGHYIFSGFLTSTPPFTQEDNNYHGDNNKIYIEAGNGLKVFYNIPGSLFTEGVNIFQLIDDIKDALSNNDSEFIRKNLDKIHEAFNKINLTHTSLGTKINNLNNLKDNLSNKNLFITKIVSKNEDADMADAIPKLYTYQSSYQAILYSFAKISSINLFDIIG